MVREDSQMPLRRTALRTVAFMALPLAAAACSGGSAPVSTPTATSTVAPETTASAVAEATPATRPPLIAIDAGHGHPLNVGAAHHDAQGREDLLEKDLNLDIARRIDRLARAAGYRTLLVRDCDCGLSAYAGTDFNESVREESQARADIANAAGADIMLVIHFNGSDDKAQGGTEVYFNPDRAFGDKNLRLATALHDSVIAAIRAIPYDDRDRGILDDASIGMRFGQAHTFLLGESPGFRPLSMPAALVEGLFVSNDAVAALLMRDDVRETIARGYVDGVRAYFGPAN